MKYSPTLPFVFCWLSIGSIGSATEAIAQIRIDRNFSVGAGAGAVNSSPQLHNTPANAPPATTTLPAPSGPTAAYSADALRNRSSGGLSVQITLPLHHERNT